MGPIYRDFANLGAFVYIITQPVKPNRTVWGDYGTDMLIDTYGYEILDIPYVIFELRFDVIKQKLNPIHSLCMQHNNITSKLFSILKHFLGESIEWDNNEKKAICFTRKALPTF